MKATAMQATKLRSTTIDQTSAWLAAIIQMVCARSSNTHCVREVAACMHAEQLVQW